MVPPAKSNVLENSLVEQHALLLNKSDVVSEPVDVKGLDRITINRYLTGSRHVETHK